MTEEKIKHLEFIQNIITRMNTNSFQIKGWTITIVSALLAIYASTKNCYFVLSAIFPSVIFWFLDSYYLTQERKFRGIYNDVAGISENPKQTKMFEMRPDLYTGGDFSYYSVFCSPTIFRFYFSIILVLGFIFYIFKIY